MIKYLNNRNIVTALIQETPLYTLDKSELMSLISEIEKAVLATEPKEECKDCGGTKKVTINKREYLCHCNNKKLVSKPEEKCECIISDQKKYVEDCPMHSKMSSQEINSILMEKWMIRVANQKPALEIEPIEVDRDIFEPINKFVMKVYKKQCEIIERFNNLERKI